LRRDFEDLSQRIGKMTIMAEQRRAVAAILGRIGIIGIAFWALGGY